MNNYNSEINLPYILDNHLTNYLNDILIVTDKELIHDAMFDAIHEALDILVHSKKISKKDAEEVINKISRLNI